ncbi:MAG: nitroreductase family protein [Finegoldia sp.]|nr:nitroreductase family protein [Finegoldia sp.]
MAMKDFLEERRSVRDFKKQSLDEGTLKKITDMLYEKNELSKGHSVKFSLYTDGKQVYDGLNGYGGYKGVMISAPHYISMEILDQEDLGLVYGSYYLESIITKLTDLGVGSCWVTIVDAPDDIVEKTLNTANRVDFLLAIGNPAGEYSFGSLNYSSREGVESYVRDSSLKNPIQMEKLESYGLDELFNYLRYAPSTRNEQGWRFVLENDHFDLYMKETNLIENLVDAGIVMYYYSALAEYENIKVEWTMDKDAKKADGYIYIASANF